ncbi:MAG: succinate dehydrogenase, hydrophobic membrane anchor protein [gamma proteobacterium symbiont of Taylorina sp.]|nr:succinate dehydrogenase, hydrophobic membrane anchor protein [gamma proteobacterium symbiont of Taylorina sp.]
MDKNNLQSDLAQSKGRGSTNDGTLHFLQQRITALALIPLVFWLCLSLTFLPETDYFSLISWIQEPINSILLVVMLIAGFYHLQLGLQVIIEDYVSSDSIKLMSIIFIKLMCIFLTVAGLYSLMKISL